MVAHRNRHRGKLVARRAVEMHVALHGDCGAARRRGESIGRGLAMGAPLFAISLDIAGAAEKAALAREAHGSHARDHVGETGRNRKRRVLKRVGDEAPVQP